MEGTILHKLLEQTDAQSIIKICFANYSALHSKGGSRSESVLTMFTRLLGDYLKNDCVRGEWNDFILKEEAKRFSTKEIDTYVITISPDMIPNTFSEFSRCDEFDRNNIPRSFQNFFDNKRKAKRVWIVLAAVAACFIIDTEELSKCFINLVGDNNIEEDFFDVEKTEQAKILIEIMLNDFNSCLSVSQNKVATKKHSSAKHVSDFNPSDSSDELLYGKGAYGIAKNKIELNIKHSIKKHKNTPSRESLLKEYHRIVTGKLCKIIEFNWGSTHDGNIDKVDSFESISADIELLKNYLKIAADRIITEVNQQPLMQYLFGKRSEYWEEYYELLRSIAHYDNGTVTVAPPVYTLLNQLKSSIDAYAKEKFYTSCDLYDLLGKLALSATRNDNDCYNIVFDEYSNIQQMIVEDLQNDIKKRVFPWITYNCENDNYRFSLKQYRLIFAAIAKANEVNRYLQNQDHNSEALANQILNEMGLYVDDVKSAMTNYDIDTSYGDSRTPNHVTWKFDSLIVYSTALCLSVSTEIFYWLIDKLCDISSDFSVKNKQRIRQEGAISIICNLMCEKNNILPNVQCEMFQRTYGKSIYYYQISSWNIIHNISPFFANKVAESMELACRIDGNGYAKIDPYFVFLVGHLGQTTKDKLDPLLVSACELQSEIWSPVYNNSEDNLNYYREKISEKLRVISLKKDDPVANISSLCYACNILLYALSDIERGSTKSGLSWCFQRAYDNNPDWAIDLNELIVFCDYYNRRLNRKYDTNCLNQITGSNDFFMLCGPYRVTSVKEITQIIRNKKVQLSNKAEQYEKWYEVECGRYKVLLARLLLICTDYFDGNNHMLNLTASDISDGFLDYDSIDTEALKSIIDNNILSQSQKEEQLKIVLTK